MKKKILFFGWEDCELIKLKSGIIKFLGEDFEPIFVQYDTKALEELAKAKFVDDDLIRIIVFKRNTLVVNSHSCRLIARFAEYLIPFGKMLLPINLIYNDQDVEGRDSAVSAYFAKEGDWLQVFTIIENHFKS